MCTTKKISRIFATLLIATWCFHASIARANSRNATPAADAMHMEGFCPPTGFSTYRTEHFDMVHEANSAWAHETGRFLEQVHDEFYRSFAEAGFTLHPSTARLTWVCFSRHDAFNRYAREADRMDMSWLDEYYSARTNRVALVSRPRPAPPAPIIAQNDGVQATNVALTTVSPLQPASSATYAHPWLIQATRASHEAAHQLSFNSGLLKRGVMYPLWSVEGLATNFEANDSGAVTLGGDNDARARCLSAICKRNALIPLDRFVAYTSVMSNTDTAVDVYAQSWAFFRFLMERHRPELINYLATMAQRGQGACSANTLRAEFIAAFGPISEIEAEWRGYVGQPIARDSVVAQVRLALEE